MADDPFAQDPFSGPQNDFIKLTDYAGELLWITPLKYHEAVATVNGPAAAVDADVVVLTGKDKDKVLKNIRIFGKWLVPSVRGNIGGKPVVGVVIKDETKKVKGKNPPWVLRDPDSKERDIALAHYETLKAQSPFEAPAKSE